MPVHLQQQLNVYIVDYTNDNTNNFVTNVRNKQRDYNNDSTTTSMYYSKPIVNEKASAKIAKDKFAAIRNLSSTKQLAKAVYIKHGSRNNNQQRQKRNHQDTKVVESLFAEKNSSNSSESEISPKKSKKSKLIPNQATLIDLFSKDTRSNEKIMPKSDSSKKKIKAWNSNESQLNDSNCSNNKSQTIISLLGNYPSQKSAKETNTTATRINDMISKPNISPVKPFFSTNSTKPKPIQMPEPEQKISKDS